MDQPTVSNKDFRRLLQAAQPPPPWDNRYYMWEEQNLFSPLTDKEYLENIPVGPVDAKGFLLQDGRMVPKYFGDIPSNFFNIMPRPHETTPSIGIAQGIQTRTLGIEKLLNGS